MNTFERLRLAAKLTQSEVAVRLGVNRSTVAKWETGAAQPRAGKLPQLAALYGCSIDELFKVVTDNTAGRAV